MTDNSAAPDPDRPSGAQPPAELLRRAISQVESLLERLEGPTSGAGGGEPSASEPTSPPTGEHSGAEAADPSRVREDALLDAEQLREAAETEAAAIIRAAQREAERIRSAAATEVDELREQGPNHSA